MKISTVIKKVPAIQAELAATLWKQLQDIFPCFSCFCTSVSFCAHYLSLNTHKEHGRTRGTCTQSERENTCMKLTRFVAQRAPFAYFHWNEGKPKDCTVSNQNYGAMEWKSEGPTKNNWMPRMILSENSYTN